MIWKASRVSSEAAAALAAATPGTRRQYACMYPRSPSANGRDPNSSLEYLKAREYSCAHHNTSPLRGIEYPGCLIAVIRYPPLNRTQELVCAFCRSGWIISHINEGGREGGREGFITLCAGFTFVGMYMQESNSRNPT